MVMIKKCCCGCPLREGSLAMVILDLISTCSFIIYHGAMTNTYNHFITFILVFHPVAGIIGILKDIPRYILIHVAGSLGRLSIIGFDILLLFLFSKTILIPVDIPKDRQIEFVAIILGAWATYVYYIAMVYSYYQESTERIESSVSAMNDVIMYLGT